MIQPTDAQLAVRNANDPGLLILAPAGCGKTEALALRVAGLLEQGSVPAPRKILVATFTNRARDNIRERLRTHVLPSDFRDRVAVQNFHGLAARIFQAHANVIDMDPEMTMPERDWVTDQCKLRKLSFQSIESVQEALREAKSTARTDVEVLAALGSGSYAHAIETVRQQQARLTYDDLLRCAELILQHDAVAGLYQNHFACVVVDEFQDLTLQQLRLVQRIAYGRTTYAGDLAQGIYGFAGADPRSVEAAIRAEVTLTIPFSESHRSSPAVLAMVNALRPLTGGQELTCAQPDTWPGGGIAARVSFATANEEAHWAIGLARSILDEAPGQRVAIIARAKTRRRFVDQLSADALGHACYRWDDPILDTQMAPLLRNALQRASAAGLESAEDPAAYLWQLAQGQDVQDPGTRELLSDAINWAVELVAGGESPAGVAARITVGDADTLLTVPGIHLLTGHVGKGQQFDWVIIVGLEDGCLPDFRSTSADGVTEEARVLSVMISRARHGVVLSRAQQVPTQNGRVWYRDPSRFLGYFDSVPVCQDGSGLRLWIKNADWRAITARGSQ